MLQHPSPATRPEARALLDWYDRSRRELPWRSAPGESADPYRVWLSEIMLQQTTVAAVKPYFLAFVARWPTVSALAAAEDAEVLAAWAGLGYYSRARNLLACARQVATVHHGHFPDEEARLRDLPGIGAYTAAAIAAIAFARRAVVVDGNVERVVSRYFALTEPLPRIKPDIRRHADLLTPGERPGDYAQAMMDLGATICTPRKPACGICPLMEGCAARRRGIADTLPAKEAKAEKPVRRGAAFVLRDSTGRILVRTRPSQGLLGGMTEVPTTDWGVNAPMPEHGDGAPVVASWRDAGSIVHVFTHFRLELAVFTATIAADGAIPAYCRWIDPNDIATAGFPTVFRKVLARAD